MSLRSRAPVLVFAAVAAAAAAAAAVQKPHAAEVTALIISRNGDTYRISLDAVVKAPAPAVHAVLADYGRLAMLSPVIAEISVQRAPDGRSERVRSVLRSCFLFFCKEVVQVEDVTEPDNRTIVARMVPGLGDFSDGYCVWRITGDGERTRLHYEATRTIAFWVPPLIGPWAIRQTMREHLESSITALERIANQSAPSRH
jgi:carbon monoxide dehydrogenase subunit G